MEGEKALENGRNAEKKPLRQQVVIPETAERFL